MGPRGRAWSELGGQMGKKLWECPLVEYVLGFPGTKTESLCLASLRRGGPSKFEEIFFKWVPHRRNSHRDVPSSQLGSKHVGHLAHLQKIWLESMCFSAGTPLPSLGLIAQASLEEFQLSTPVAPRCCRHMPSLWLGSLRWSAPSSSEIGVGLWHNIFLCSKPYPSADQLYGHVWASTLAAPAFNTINFFLQGCSLEVGPLAVSGWQTGQFPRESTPSALVLR